MPPEKPLANKAAHSQFWGILEQKWSTLLELALVSTKQTTTGWWERIKCITRVEVLDAEISLQFQHMILGLFIIIKRKIKQTKINKNTSMKWRQEL